MKTRAFVAMIGAVLLTAGALTADDKAVSPTTAAEAANATPGAKAAAENAGATNGAVVIRQYARLLYKIEQDPKSGDPDLVAPDALGEAWFRISHGSDKTLPPIKVSGRTLDEVRSEIKAALDKDYYVDCTIRLTLESNGAAPVGTTGGQGAGRVLFVGPTLRGPVSIPPGSRVTISEAVLQLPADQYANLSKVEIERQDPVTKKLEIIKVDVEAILHKGKRDQDVDLKDGDRIKVPEKYFLIR